MFDTGGNVYTDQTQIYVRYVAITSPTSSPLPVFTDEAKPGFPLDIVGRARPAPASRASASSGRRAATPATGWSSAGVTLTGDGTGQLDGAASRAVDARGGSVGEYTIRVTVTNTGFTSESRTNVYLEPDLVSTHWPTFAGPTSSGEGPLPAKMANGDTRLILCGWINAAGTPCSSFTADGSLVNTLQLDVGAQIDPSAGSSTAPPGDELVIPDHKRSEITKPDFDTGARDRHAARRIVQPRSRQPRGSRRRRHHGDRCARARDATRRGSVVQLDGVAPGVPRRRDVLSPNYPHALTSSRAPNGLEIADSVVVIWTATARRRSLVAHRQQGGRPLRDPGLPRGRHALTPPGRRPRSRSTAGIDRLLSADLDHDGRPEILIGEYVSNDWQLRVFNSDGTTRPGWPVRGLGSGVVIGDLDRDESDEIVGVDLGPGLMVFRPDGSHCGPAPFFASQNSAPR